MNDAAAEPRIAVLSEVVRNQIAAREVIERPASVVRGLRDHAVGGRGWDAAKLRTYRVNVGYPVVGRQISIALDAHGS